MTRFQQVFPLAVPPRHPLRSRLERALEVLAPLHGWPAALPELGIRTEPMPDRDGLFDPQRPELGVRIADETRFPCFTVAHEIAHALDWYVFGGGQGYGNRANTPLWSEWLAAVQASASYAHLQERLHDDFPAVREFARYLLQPEELFARAYAQWAATVSASGDFAGELAPLLERDPRPQWQAGEFVTIQAATTALLRSLTPAPAGG